MRTTVVVLGLLAALALLLRLDSRPRISARASRAAAAGVVVVSLLAGGLGTAAWTLATASQPHTGSIPISGPTASAMGGMGGGPRGADGAGGAAGMGGGMPGENATSTELTQLLKSSNAKWSAIVSGATQAAGLELATGTSVIALGGWNGGDGGGAGASGPGGGNSEVADWVAANFKAQTVGDSTAYKLAG